MIAAMQTNPKTSRILRRLMDEKGVTQSELSRRTGVQQSTLSRILRPSGVKGIVEPTDRQLRPLAQFFGVTTDQLRGYQPIDVPGGDQPSVEVVAKPDLCPLIEWEQARSWPYKANHLGMSSTETWLPCPVPHSNSTYILRVTGESMHNPQGDRSFKPGDLIYVDPEREAVSGSLVIALFTDGDNIIFRQLFKEGASRYLKALNPAWPEAIVKANGDASVIGVVIGKLETFV